MSTNLLTAGAIQLTAQTQIQGAQIAPQGTTATVTLSSPEVSEQGSGTATFSFGNSSSGQCDILCAADYDITSSSAIIIDLFANGLPNVFGGTANFLHLRAVFIGIVSGGDASGIQIGNASSNPHPLFFGSTSGTWNITNTGIPLQGCDANGIVVSSTARNVKILNNSAVTATVRVILGGTTT